MQSDMDLYQQFMHQQSIREQMSLPKTLSAIMDHCEYRIRGQFNKKDKVKFKSKKRVQEISEDFMKAFAVCSRQEKIKYYVRMVHHIRRIYNGCRDPPNIRPVGFLNAVGFARSFNLKIWKKKVLQFDLERHLLYAEKDKKIKNYDLTNYLLRASKCKDYFCFVLEAVNNKPHDKSRTVHIGFDSPSRFEEWYEAMKVSMEYAQWKFVKDMMSDPMARTNTSMFFRRGEIIQSDSMGSSEEEVVDSPLNRSCTLADLTRQKRNMQFEEEDTNPQSIMSSKELKLQNKQSKKQEQKNGDKVKIMVGNNKEQLEYQIKQFQTKRVQPPVKKTIVDELIEGQIFEEAQTFEERLQEQNDKACQGKKNLDLFHKMYPEYELKELENFENFQLFFEEGTLRLYKNLQQERRLKMVFEFSRSERQKAEIISLISKPEAIKGANKVIEDVQIKLFISSENSAIMYQVNKAYNRLYRPRDFVFIRHMFSDGNKLYMIDKSVENSNYPPFMTIVRGELCIVWGVLEEGSQIKLIADVLIKNEGYVNAVQEFNLTAQLLKGYVGLKEASAQASYRLFDLGWDINKNETNKIENEIRIRRNTLKNIQIHETQKQISVNLANKEETLSPTSFKKKSNQQLPLTQSKMNEREESAGKISSKTSLDLKPVYVDKQLQQQISNEFPKGEEGNLNQNVIKIHSQSQLIRQLNPDGSVLINQNYLKQKYRLEPCEKLPYQYMPTTSGHPIWAQEWRHDEANGALIYINKKKIEDQKGVLKFILTKIGKNLLSGKSILNISLPVDIFASESNLERLIISMSYAPFLLEKCRDKDILSKFKQVVAYGITNSVLYLNIEKPFNPILGETLQCWINGCPVYAEQISHHPPIGALMFKGRGYEITSQLESKIELHMNSGTGINEGVFRVRFTDGDEIYFNTPGGQLSGLTYGQRKFNIVGKSYYWMEKTNLVLEIVFDPNKKGFFSIGKQEKPSDYFEGVLYEVLPDFMATFVKGKRKQPSEKDRLRELGKFSGIWNQFVMFNNEELVNLDNQFPLKLEYEPFPLPSDSNWREDIEYRRRGETIKAQSYKQKLQVFQRTDRKLRQKFKKQS